MSNNFPPEYREPYHLLDSDPRIDVREARINFRIGIQDALARQRYLELERQIDSLINQHPNNLKSKLSDWKQAFFALVEGPKDEDRYFNLYTTSNFEAIRGEVDSLAGENLLATENTPQAVFAKIPLMSPELLHYSMLENLIKRVLLQVKNDTARESIKTRLNEIFHALYAKNDWNFRHRTNWMTIWDQFREIELHWVTLFGLYAQLIHNCKPPEFIERLELKRLGAMGDITPTCESTFLLLNTLSNIVASTEGMLSRTESKLMEMREEEERGFSSTIAREGKA